MLLDVALKLVTIVSVLVGGVAVYIALRNNSRQIGAQIFLTYSSRIHYLRETRLFDVDLHHWPRQTDEAENIRHAILAAYWVIFEFYSLRRYGFVANSIWKIWEADIVRLLGTPAFQTEWDVIRPHFEVHSHFTAWVNARHGSV